MTDLLIDRREFASFELRESVEPALDPGHAVVAVDRFGLRHVAASGVDGLWAMVAESWRRFIAWTDGWLAIEHAEGAPGIERAYRAVVGGDVDPATGFVITPTEENR